MTSPLAKLNFPAQGSDAMSIPDEGTSVIYPQVGAVQLGAMRVVCHQLLQILGATQLEGHQAIRDPAISETQQQLEMVRESSSQLLQVLESPHNVSNAVSLGGNQVRRDPSPSWIYPQVTLTATQLGVVWVAYSRLLQVYGSLPVSNATKFDGYQLLRESGVSQLHQVTLVVTHVNFVLAVCNQILQEYGMLPSEDHSTQPGDHQMLADNAYQILSQIQSLVPEAAQTTDVREAGVPAGGDTSRKLHCPCEGCNATFGRLQERKRHLIDVHTPRRRCPFCPYKWSRPNKVKAHLMVNHQDKPLVLNEIRAKRGQRLVAFLNTLCSTMNKSRSQLV